MFCVTHKKDRMVHLLKESKNLKKKEANRCEGFVGGYKGSCRVFLFRRNCMSYCCIKEFNFRCRLHVSNARTELCTGEE